MVSPSKIAQLHTTNYLRFVSTKMFALNPNILKRATSESVIVGPGKFTPLTLRFSQLMITDEWKVDYQALQPKYHPSRTSKI
jgi:hypothetical protein